MENLYDENWAEVLSEQFKADSWKNLNRFLSDERKNFEIFPPEEQLFEAMRLTPYKSIKVVILGQDPYHNIGQAHGLAFSVPDGVPFPPSLRNIFKELSDDILGFEIPDSGDLSKWATQGVLLLNATLTVRAHEAGSHQNQGWENLTDSIIQRISHDLNAVVFILWGAYAQKKRKFVDESKHLVLSSAHPSPLSVYRGFWGSKPFSQVNDYLIKTGQFPIDWRMV